MSKADKRALFASMERARARRRQVEQDKKRELMDHLVEYNGMVQNLEALNMISSFLGQLTIKGSEARNLSRCQHWIQGMTQGMTTRRDELKAKLPKQDLEVKMGPEEEPEPAGEPAPEQTPMVAVGGIEIQKGDPVLGMA